MVVKCDVLTTTGLLLSLCLPSYGRHALLVTYCFILSAAWNERMMAEIPTAIFDNERLLWPAHVLSDLIQQPLPEYSQTFTREGK